MRPWRSRWALVLVGFATVMLSSCGGGPKGGERIQIFPVHGEVFIDGKPGKDAFVFLHPKQPVDNPNPGRPIASLARVNEKGEFKISTYESGDGAPPGEYTISVTWNEATGIMKDRFDGPDRLKGRYADPEKTGFKVEVPENAPAPIVIPRLNLEISK